jgi:hypothetical protein
MTKFLKMIFLAGFAHVDGYVSPCIEDDPIYCSYSFTNVEQLTYVANALKENNATIDRVWVDMTATTFTENDPNNCNWFYVFLHSANHFLNQAKYKPGVYTNDYQLNYTVGSRCSLGEFGNPLWWPNFNKIPDLSTDWSPFGMWKTPLLHDYYRHKFQFGVNFNIFYYQEIDN